MGKFDDAYEAHVAFLARVLLAVQARLIQADLKVKAPRHSKQATVPESTHYAP